MPGFGSGRIAFTETLSGGGTGRLYTVTIAKFHDDAWGRFSLGVLRMSAVMIRCPATGHAVSTAIEIEPAVFRKLPKVAARMHCPACGHEHVWMTSSAWLSGEPRVVEVPPRETEAA